MFIVKIKVIQKYNIQLKISVQINKIVNQFINYTIWCASYDYLLSCINTPQYLFRTKTINS